MVLLAGVEPALLTKQFERLPEELLSVMARNFPAQMQRLLETYLVAIEAVLGDRGYSYGEFVAAKVRIIFDNTDDARLKALTLKVSLVVAVSLNRFAAMDIFDAMLVKITRPEDALAVADVLREELDRYSIVASRVPRRRLQRVIAEVYDEATAPVPNPPIEDAGIPF